MFFLQNTDWGDIKINTGGRLARLCQAQLEHSDVFYSHRRSAVQRVSSSILHYPYCLIITLPPPLPSAPSAPPQEVRSLSLSSTSIKVSWEASPTDSRQAEIVRYSLAYQAVTGEDMERHQVSGIGADVTSYVVEGLEKWTEYMVWVRAHTEVGPSPESPASHIRTQEDGM